MIPNCNCYPRGSCTHGTNYTSYTATLNAASNTISIDTSYYSNRRHRSALELERELKKFERLAKWKPPRQVVKVDEKRLIAKPTRSHAKPHQAQSSRAAISVRQFAARVK